MQWTASYCITCMTCIFRIRSRPMFLCCVLELDHFTILKGAVQNSAKEDAHCTTLCTVRCDSLVNICTLLIFNSTFQSLRTYK